REYDAYVVGQIEAVNISALADVSDYTWRGWYQTMRGGRIYRAGQLFDWKRAQGAVEFAGALVRSWCRPGTDVDWSDRR
ncbi:MAG: hypothetical protein ACPGNP_12760, partial [Acidimicrobiales bacterium]